MAMDPSWANPMTTRSRIVLEIAAELVAGEDQPFKQAKVLLREQGKGPDWPFCLFGTSTIEGIEAVVKREADLAMINPSGPLNLAYRGTGPYSAPQPVRVIAVIPSDDQYVFAVKRETGLTRFEEIAEKRVPLRVSLRGQPDHCLHSMLDHITAAAGFSMDDVVAWGGEVRREGSLPWADGPKFKALARGEINAIFDEAVQEWINEAMDADMTILPLAEATVQKLEALGYRRAVIEKRLYPRLPQDVLTIDFSGWPIFVHAEMPDRTVERICAALDARKHLIPWQGNGPLPVERMCRAAPDTPMDVPLHDAAERFWRARGYLA
jgi:TRAP-type uncharacterized transport system substrate-binding protein